MNRRNVRGMCVWPALLAFAAGATVCTASLADDACDPAELQKLTAADAAAQSQFGWRVALSGDVAIVGARHDSQNGTDAGAAYIFRHDGREWMQEQKLLPSTPEAGASFGYSVDISGDVAIVGANRSTDLGNLSGSAYIFRYNGEQWVEDAKLLASMGTSFQQFGWAVAIDGDNAIVGTPRDHHNGTWAGSAYGFQYQDGQWVETQKLLASNGSFFDEFGSSVAIDGGRAIIGAPFTGNYWGTAYIFQFEDQQWVERAHFTASDVQEDDRFAWSVAISGDVAVAGAYWNEHAGPESGAAYVFRYNGTVWQQEQKLIASDAATWDHFGYSVAVDGDQVLVGSRWQNEVAIDGGAAYLYRFDDKQWTQEAKLMASDGAMSVWFGNSVAMQGNTVLIGANRTNEVGNNSGSAYIFDLGCPMPPIPGDFNGDGVVDVSDLLILLGEWGACADCNDCPADLNNDCTVDVSDLLILLGNWG